MKFAKVFAAVLAFTTTAAAFSLEVNKSELQSADMDTVVFENYAGPYDVINTIEEIRAIGTRLAPPIHRAPEKAAVSGEPARYYVIHAVDPEETGKLDADVFIIGPGAGVDHINNVRRIIGAYLEAAYDYSREDADTIATFVTVYNAVYRGNLDAYRAKYKEAVTKNLTADKAGIALTYKEWAGKTQIVIPLSDLSGAGGLSTVETSTISDREVVKSLQEEEDMGIDSRKAMVDIKEREADEQGGKAEEAQKAADAEKAKADEAKADAAKAKAEADAAAAKAASDKAKADAAKAEADKAKADAEEAKKNAASNPKDAQAKADAESAQKDAQKAEKDAQSAQKDADQSAKEAEEAKKDAEQAAKTADEQTEKAESAQAKADSAQEKADQKRSEAQEERAAIAQDQQSVIEKNERNENAPSLIGLKALDEQGQTAALVRMNAQSGEIIKESPVALRGRAFFDTGDAYIAIAGENAGNGAVKLVLLDKDKMEITAESTDRIAELSSLVENGGSYFCVMQEGSNFFLAKFSPTLERQLKSPVAVKPATPITVSADGI
ncbi:MAG: hypothetical protein K6G80_05195, partial [Treponema sp.]|nr:hypothetical protein [Treponema sp.]